MPCVILYFPFFRIQENSIPATQLIEELAFLFYIRINRKTNHFLWGVYIDVYTRAILAFGVAQHKTIKEINKNLIPNRF